MDEKLREAIERLLRSAEEIDDVVTDLQAIVQRHVKADSMNIGCMSPRPQREFDQAIEDVRREIRCLDMAAMTEPKSRSRHDAALALVRDMAKDSYDVGLAFVWHDRAKKIAEEVRLG